MKGIKTHQIMSNLFHKNQKDKSSVSKESHNYKGKLDKIFKVPIKQPNKSLQNLNNTNNNKSNKEEGLHKSHSPHSKRKDKVSQNKLF